MDAKIQNISPNKTLEPIMKVSHFILISGITMIIFGAILPIINTTYIIYSIFYYFFIGVILIIVASGVKKMKPWGLTWLLVSTVLSFTLIALYIFVSIVTIAIANMFADVNINTIILQFIIATIFFALQLKSYIRLDRLFKNMNIK